MDPRQQMMQMLMQKGMQPNNQPPSGIDPRMMAQMQSPRGLFGLGGTLTNNVRM